MTSSPQTPDEYIASLPDERRDAVATVREMVRQNLPAGFEKGIRYGAIGWYVPLERFPDTYNGETIARTDLDSYLAHYAAARGSSRQTRET